VLLRWGNILGELPLANVYAARERAQRGDGEEAKPLMRAAVDHLFREGRLLLWGVPATGVLVETLLDRGNDGDVAEAEVAIERLAAPPADEGLAMRDIWLLRLRALLAGLTVMLRLTHTSAIATATRRKRLASKGISRGQTRCHDGGRSLLASAARPNRLAAGLPRRIPSPPLYARDSLCALRSIDAMLFLNPRQEGQEHQDWWS
jgi:hypothetical protein